MEIAEYKRTHNCGSVANAQYLQRTWADTVMLRSPQTPLLSLVCTTTSNSSSFSLSSQLNKFPCVSSQLLLKRPLLDYQTTPHKPCVSKTKLSTPHCHIYIYTNDCMST